MPGIQYHYVIPPDGVVWWCNDDDRYVWHGHDWNVGLGVCLIGDFTTGEPTDAQIAAARWLYAQKQREHGPLRMVGHKEAPRASTECPGRTWEQWRDRIGKEEVAMTPASKLGIHFITPPELGKTITDAIRNSPMRWVKGLNVDHWPSTAAEMFPDQRVICRMYQLGDAGEHALMRQGATGADEYFRIHRDRIIKARDGGCLDFEGPNEPHPGLGDNDPRTLEAFWLRLIDLYASVGVRPWVWSFGVGWPGDDMAHYHVESIRRARDAGGGLAVHEYGAPGIMDGKGYRLLRILKTMAELEAAGLDISPAGWVAVTEMGIAWAVIAGNPDKGWQWWPGKEQGQNQWVYPPEYGLGYGVMDEERYWRHISDADDHYCRIPQVACATPFTTCPTTDWSTFDFGEGLVLRACEKHAQHTWTDAEIGAAVAEGIQRVVLPLNPAAALYRAAKAKDTALVPASDEVPGHVLVPGLPTDTIAQAFRKGEEWQEIAWTRIGEWAPNQVRWVRRKN